MTIYPRLGNWCQGDRNSNRYSRSHPDPWCGVAMGSARLRQIREKVELGHSPLLDLLAGHARDVSVSRRLAILSSIVANARPPLASVGLHQPLSAAWHSQCGSLGAGKSGQQDSNLEEFSFEHFWAPRIEIISSACPATHGHHDLRQPPRLLHCDI